MPDNVVVVVGDTQEDHDTHLAYVTRKLNGFHCKSEASELELTSIMATCSQDFRSV